MKKIKYAIADSREIFRKGIIASMAESRELLLVLESENSQKLRTELEAANPDVVLVGIHTGEEISEIESVKKIRQLYAHVKIIVLSMNVDERLLDHFIESGVNGCLNRENTEPPEIILAMQTAVLNGYYFNDIFNKELFKRVTNKIESVHNFNDAITLTVRESEILKLICKEFTTAEIAKTVFLSPRTVDGIRAKLMDKIGVKNAVGLMRYALKKGLVE